MNKDVQDLFKDLHDMNAKILAEQNAVQDESGEAISKAAQTMKAERQRIIAKLWSVLSANPITAEAGIAMISYNILLEVFMPDMLFKG